MSKVKFNADEMMVMAMFEQPTRTETMTFAVQTKLPKKLQSISMERPLIRFVRNLLPIARITLKKVH